MLTMRIEKRSDDVTKTKFVKLWDKLVYPEGTEMKTVLPPKASLLVQIVYIVYIMSPDKPF